jgi:hypothetical protein
MNGVDSHFLERVHLLRPVDLDMRNVLCRERDIEEVVFIVLCVRHGVLALSFVPGSFSSSSSFQRSCGMHLISSCLCLYVRL